MADLGMTWWAKAMLQAGAVVGDTETTGFGKKDRVIELAFVDGGTGLRLLSSLIDTDAVINPKAQEVHNITKEMLRGKPTILKALEVASIVIGNKPVLFYNADFDMRLINQSLGDAPEFRKDKIKPTFNINYWCLMEAYRTYAGLSKAVSLTTACTQMEVQAGNHRATDDAKATAYLLQAMAVGKQPNLEYTGRPASCIINPLNADFEETNPDWKLKNPEIANL